MFTSCVVKEVSSYMDKLHLPSASAPIKAAVEVSGSTSLLSRRWYLSLLTDCEGRSCRDISNSFIYLYLSVQITHDSLVIIKFPHTFSNIYFILSLD